MPGTHSRFATAGFSDFAAPESVASQSPGTNESASKSPVLALRTVANKGASSAATKGEKTAAKRRIWGFTALPPPYKLCKTYLK